MSDIGIRVSQKVDSVITPVAPWAYIPSFPEGTGFLDLRLTAGKVGGGGWYPGYIPREGALPEIDLAVDLENGGDAEQLRAIKVQIADQMSDGQSMSAWLHSVGVTLSGAAIAIYEDVLPGGTIPSDPLWTGVIRQQPRLAMTRMELSCESPLDSDPIGEIVSDSAIRPIIYGQAEKVKLPALPIAEDVVSPLVRNVCSASQPWGSPPARWIMGSSDSAGLLYATLEPLSNKAYVVLTYGLYAPDLSDWFPGNIVPDSSDWYVEVVSGKGAGAVRRLTAGSAVVITEPGGGIDSISHPFAGQNLEAVRASEWTRTIKLEIDQPFLDIESGTELLKGLYSRTYNSSGVPSDTWIGGSVHNHPDGMYEITNPDPPNHGTVLSTAYLPDPERSYLRIVRKGRSFALPINSGLITALPIYVKKNSRYIQVYNTEELFRIDSGILRVIPSADSMDKVTCYDRLRPNWDFSRVLAEGGLEPPTLASSLETLFSGYPGSTLYYNRFRSPASMSEYRPAIWNPQNHIRIGVASDTWDLEGADKILLCVDATFVWEGTVAEPDGVRPVVSLVAMRSGLLESWWHGHWAKYPLTFGLDLPDRPGRELYLNTAKPSITLNSIPPGSSTNPGPKYRWMLDAVQLPVSQGFDKATVYFSIFLGAMNPWRLLDSDENVTQIRLRQLMLFAARVNNLSEVYVDLFGPTYSTDSGTTGWSKRINGDIGWPAVPLTDGISASEVIADHAHAYEDIFRRHTKTPWLVNPVDGASIEQACVDLWTKTQVGFTPLPATSRPRLAVAFTESAPQIGSVVAQLCRDGMLVGSRNGRGQRVLQSLLARTLLEEQDATINEDELYQGSISESPVSPLSKLVSAPLIRYNQQGGAPGAYIQVTRPDADEWDPAYTIGFNDLADAQRAWEICHRGWLESGVAHARELRMDSIPDYDSLIEMIMQPRGTTFLDWLSRPKSRLIPVVPLSHPAVRLPRGSRVKIFHWRFAPSGAWGTLTRVRMQPEAKVAPLELIMDLDP